MSQLRIYCPLDAAPPPRCEWALVDGRNEPVAGESALMQLPQRVEGVQLVVPGAQVLFTRARVPAAARRRPGPALAYAVEAQSAADPDANEVCWLGSAGGEDVLAVLDKRGLAQWQEALAAAGISLYEVQCETLLLPRSESEWSLAWDGHAGFVRTSNLEGAATDSGDRASPPLSLRLMVEEADSRGERPRAIAVYTTLQDAMPDADAWSRELGVAVRLAGPWSWRTAPPGDGVSLMQRRLRWRGFNGLLSRLRPAGLVLAAALAFHAAALAVDWAWLASERWNLRQRMEARFRAAVPDAVAVVDPALQMRRKLAEARHASGQLDGSDFLPMVDKVASEIRDFPAGSLRSLAYESGRVTLEIAAVEDARARRLAERLRNAGLVVEVSLNTGRPGIRILTVVVRSS